MQGSHAWRADSAMFDEDNLVSHAGLVPLLELAEQTGLSRLFDEHVRFVGERVGSGAANATPKLTSIIAGMAAGADSIDDLDVIRSGGMKKLFDGVYAAATLGIFLREFTHGHTRQLSAVLRRHLVALAERTPVSGRHRAAGVHRHRLAAAPGLRTRQTRRVVRPHQNRRQERFCAGACHPWRSRSPPRTRRRCWPASGCGPGGPARRKAPRRCSPKRSTPPSQPAPSPTSILVRGDSAYCGGKIIAAVVKAGARFSFAIARNPAVDAAITSIGDEPYMPVHYPGAVVDPDTGELISDAQVAEVQYTAFAGTRHADHRPADRAPGPRRQHPGPAVPGLAPPPVLHQQPRTHEPRPTSPTAATRSAKPSGPT